MSKQTPINLGVFSINDKDLIQRIIAQTGLALTIDDPAIDPQGQIVKYLIRVNAHCPASEINPFWKAYDQARPHWRAGLEIEAEDPNA